MMLLNLYPLQMPFRLLTVYVSVDLIYQNTGYLRTLVCQICHYVSSLIPPPPHYCTHSFQSRDDPIQNAIFLQQVIAPYSSLLKALFHIDFSSIWTIRVAFTTQI